MAATILLATVGAAWSVVLPVGEGPDEPAHLGLVLHLADGGSYPRYDSLHRTEALDRLCETFVASVRVCPLPGEEVTATAVRVRHARDAPHGGGRPSFLDDGGREAVAELNQMAQHPPLYYGAMAVVLRGARTVVGGPMSLDRELALLRLVNVLLVVPVPALAWLTARRLELDLPVAASAAVATAAVPMLAASSGVLNNDNLLILLAAASAPAMASLAVGDRSRRAAVVAGATIGFALLVKAFAVVLIPALALACWIGSREPGDQTAVGARVRRTAAPLGVASAFIALIAGWWYVQMWSYAGSPTPSVDADRYSEALRPPGFSPDLVHFVDQFAGRFTERFWGSFGWYSARFPGPLTVVLTLAAVVLVGVGLVAARRRAPLVVLLTPALLLLALTFGRAWSLHARSGQYPFIQGRYLLAGLVGLAVVAAFGWRRLVPDRLSVPAMATLAAALQLGSLLRGITTYWAGGPVERIEALDAWSGLPDLLPTALVVAAVVGSVAVLVVAWRPAVDRSSGGAPVPSASR